MLLSAAKEGNVFCLSCLSWGSFLVFFYRFVNKFQTINLMLLRSLLLFQYFNRFMFQCSHRTSTVVICICNHDLYFFIFGWQEIKVDFNKLHHVFIRCWCFFTCFARLCSACNPDTVCTVYTSYGAKGQSAHTVYICDTSSSSFASLVSV